MTAKIHRAEVVGSMLRPPELLAARDAMRAAQAGRGNVAVAEAVSAEEYKALENKAIDEVLRIQEEAGLQIVTDGELRRQIFYSFLVSGLDGVTMVAGEDNTVNFHGHDDDAGMQVQIPFSVTGKVSGKVCPGVEEFLYASARTDKEVKVTLPSPLLILSNLWNEHSREAYPDPFDLTTDTRDVVAGWMHELAEAGCTYIQIDTPELSVAYTDENQRRKLAGRGIDPERFIDYGTELIASLGEVDLPGVTKAMHVCKGNGTQSWIGEGGYEAFSEKVFDEASGYDVYLMEYDDDRSGGFEPLAKAPDDKVIVLGLVSTKWVALEDGEVLKQRIEDAARFHPKENLALSTQCGFASAAESAETRKVAETTQQDKLKLVVDVAEEVWR